MLRTVFAGLIVAGLCAGETFNWRGSVAPGQTLEIRGVNGFVRVTEGSGEAVVTADKHGRKNNPGEVRVEVVPHAGGVTICAIYPPVDNKPNECRPAGGGRNNVKDNDVQVDFTVTVPRGVKLNAHTVNGAVEARNITADVNATTVNGKVDVTSLGLVRAKTVNGSINATMGATSWSGENEFATVNGGITVGLPASASADIDASVVNGDIESQFPLTIRGKFGGRHLNGTIGNGGRQLKLRTVNGSIKLNRSAS